MEKDIFIQKIKNTLLILLLIIVTTVVWIGNEIYIQFFSEITKYFQIADKDVHYLTRFNLIGCIMMSILAGPLSDTYGKRLIFILGLSAYIAGGLICFIGNNFPLFVFGRFLQGMAEATINIVSWVILLDYFAIDKSGKIAGIINAVSTLLLLLLPLMSLLISNIYNWHITIIIMPALALIALTITVFVVEEKKDPGTQKKLEFKKLFNNYLTLLKNFKFMVYTLIYSIPPAADLLFFSNASVILVNRGMSIDEFTYSNTINAICFIAASFLSIYMIDKKGLDYTKNIGYGIFLLGVLGLFAAAILDYNIIRIIFVCIFVMTIGSALMEGFLLKSVNIFPDIKGTAMSFSSIVGYILIARKVFWSQALFDGTMLPSSIVILVICIISAILFTILHYKEKINHQN